jgi:hypothetical protein
MCAEAAIDRSIAEPRNLKWTYALISELSHLSPKGLETVTMTVQAITEELL